VGVILVKIYNYLAAESGDWRVNIQWNSKVTIDDRLLLTLLNNPLLPSENVNIRLKYLCREGGTEGKTPV
jgi:hypothetical protein